MSGERQITVFDVATGHTDFHVKGHQRLDPAYLRDVINNLVPPAVNLGTGEITRCQIV